MAIAFHGPFRSPRSLILARQRQRNLITDVLTATADPIALGCGLTRCAPAPSTHASTETPEPRSPLARFSDLIINPVRSSSESVTQFQTRASVVRFEFRFSDLQGTVVAPEKSTELLAKKEEF